MADRGMTTMHDPWSDQLSEYIDDELPADGRAALEAHLAGCPDCTRTLDELRQVVAAAAAVKPQPPRTDFWDGIQGRIAATATGTGAESRRAFRRFTFTMPELAAAAVLLAAISGATGVWVTLQMNKAQNQPAGNAVVDAPSANPIEAVAFDDAPVADVMPVLSFADVQYDAAVVDLERALENGRGRLDKTTLAVVEQNLSMIDRAIAEARSALAADPSNSYLSSHLVETRRRKLDLLRRTTALMTEAN